MADEEADVLLYSKYNGTIQRLMKFRDRDSRLTIASYGAGPFATTGRLVSLARVLARPRPRATPPQFA
jgi:hypothetical protein